MNRRPSRKIILAMTGWMIAALVMCDLANASDANWPRWRGPLENGHAPNNDVPLRWSADTVIWKAKLPGVGQSSPIIWGDRIFLTSELENGRERLVFCVNRRTGEIEWRQTAWRGEPEPSHIMNGWASASCATDGDIVVAFFGIGGLHAYTVDGKPLWSRDLGRFEGPWGTAACPVIVDDLVIQNCDADVDAFLVAVDKRTGKEVWRTDRSDFRGWSTPIVIEAAGRRELVLNGHEGVRAYDPATGHELWFCQGFNGRGEPTVTPAGDLLCVVNGLAGDFYSVRPGGDGNVTKTHMAWHTPRRGGRDCPSPIVVGKYVIVSDMAGIATCYDAEDGHIHWKERLPGKYSASPIASNGMVYFLNEDGSTFVVRPGPSLDIVAENVLPKNDEEIYRATPTPSAGQLFVRSTTTLYCVGSE